MTPLQAAEQLRKTFSLHIAKPEALTNTGHAIVAAIKFIEENHCEWVKIDGPETLPEQWEDVILCYKDEGSPTVCYTPAFRGEMWNTLESNNFKGTPIAWRPLPKQIEYQP